MTCKVYGCSEKHKSHTADYVDAKILNTFHKTALKEENYTMEQGCQVSRE